MRNLVIVLVLSVLQLNFATARKDFCAAFADFRFSLISTCEISETQCFTPSRAVGVCIPLRSCGSIFGILTKGDISAEDRRFLTQSQCDYRNNSPYVSEDFIVPIRRIKKIVNTHL